MSGKLQLPSDFAKKIQEILNLKAEGLELLFDFEESKEGYFIAKLKPKQWLSELQFKAMCALARDLGGEYIKGQKAFQVPGPYAKPPKPVESASGVTPDVVALDKTKPPEFGDLVFIGWNQIKGMIVEKENVDELVKGCFERFKIWPLFLPLENGKFAVVGFSDLRRWESWCNPAIRNQLVLCSDGTKAFYNSTEHLTAKETEYTRRRILEKILQRNIISKLCLEGWQVEENVSLKIGRADIKASKGNEVMLVEVKPTSSLNSIEHALGQLLFYKEQISNGKVRLAIALPDFPDNVCQEILAKWNIEIIVSLPESQVSKDNERADQWKNLR